MVAEFTDGCVLAAASTAGVANGFVQGNLAILPEKLAAAFHRSTGLTLGATGAVGWITVFR